MHQMDVSPELEAGAALNLYFDQLAGEDYVGDNDVEADEGKVELPLIEELVRGVASHRDELDALLGGLSKNWRIERMALVDRNVIRLALYELKYSTDVPVNVIINEAIELAKQFGSAEAGAFVNGLLDRAVSELKIAR